MIVRGEAEPSGVVWFVALGLTDFGMSVSGVRALGLTKLMISSEMRCHAEMVFR
jgi:hypothetical protein